VHSSGKQMFDKPLQPFTIAAGQDFEYTFPRSSVVSIELSRAGS
jgi:hypothetical protein